MLGALAALLPAGAAAQQSDARQRTTETIVADGLAQLPAADAKVFNQVMGELAATGSKGVEMIAAMLVPADKGKNATFEYALNGVVAYVTDPAHEALRDDVRKGLLAAIDRCGDDANRAFLFSQLQFCSTAADAAATMEYALGYLRVMLAGLIPFALTQAYASTLRESGQTTLPMRASMIAMGINFVFNSLLIFGLFGFPALGVVGAGIAAQPLCGVCHRGQRGAPQCRALPVHGRRVPQFPH